jgi:hypothetical protein
LTLFPKLTYKTKKEIPIRAEDIMRLMVGLRRFLLLCVLVLAVRRAWRWAGKSPKIAPPRCSGTRKGLISMPEEKITTKELHSLLIHRIYHEDNLLQQRNYNFITANAFLAAGFVFLTIDPAKGASWFAYVIAAFGFFWALFQVMHGKKQVTAINLWRMQAWMAEKALTTKFDLTLFEFFNSGETETPFGTTIKKAPKRKKPTNQSFPYTIPFLRGANVLFGVIVPWITAVFWCALAFIMMQLHHAPREVVWSVALGAGVLFLLSCFGRITLPEYMLDKFITSLTRKA